MQLTVNPDRLDDRRTLLASLNQFRNAVESEKTTKGLNKFQSQALETLTGGIFDAFDVAKEDAKVIERYDTSKLIDPSRISKRWNNHQRYANHVKNLGKLLLLARRLAERGANFITVSTDFVWDMHADNNNATMTEGMEYVGRPFDHAVSAFIKDVESRGLRDKILLVCCGEMGRTPHTPKVSPTCGRDHHVNGYSIFMAGGGIRGGMSYGETSEFGNAAVENVLTIHDVHATILHQLGIDHQRLTFRHGGRDQRLTDVHGHVPSEILA